MAGGQYLLVRPLNKINTTTPSHTA
jgi:hypothetical protein